MNKFTTICPMCETGKLTPSTYSDTLDYRGVDLVVDDLEVSICGLCNSEIVIPKQDKKNLIKIANKKRSLDDLLTSHEIIALRKKYSLTQAQASKLFGGGANAFSKYERGDVIQSQSMDRLLRLVAVDPMLLLQLAEIAGFDLEMQKGKRVSCNKNNSSQYSTENFIAEEVELVSEVSEVSEVSVENRTKVIESKLELKEAA